MTAAHIRGQAQEGMRNEAAHSSKAPPKENAGYPNIFDKLLGTTPTSKDKDTLSIQSHPTMYQREQDIKRQNNQLFIAKSKQPTSLDCNKGEPGMYIFLSKQLTVPYIINLVLD